MFKLTKALKGLVAFHRLPPVMRRPLLSFFNRNPKMSDVPKTYSILARNLASYPTLLNKISDVNRGKSRERDEFVTVNEYDGVKPQSYDVLLTDINDNTLMGEISEELGLQYLEKAVGVDAARPVDSISSYLYGVKRRPVLACPVYKDEVTEALWVIFILDTGAPSTYLCSKALKAFNLRTNIPSLVRIAGYTHAVNPCPANSHFHDINILGSDFLDDHKVTTLFLGRGRVKYVFGGCWEKISEIQDAVKPWRRFLPWK